MDNLRSLYDKKRKKFKSERLMNESGLNTKVTILISLVYEYTLVLCIILLT